MTTLQTLGLALLLTIGGALIPLCLAGAALGLYIIATAPRPEIIPSEECPRY